MKAFFTWTCCLLFLVAPVGAADTSRPNIVFIMADDLGYAHLGCYGQTKIDTPHLDRFATEGIRFTSAYAGAPVCAPSRSVLMTGFHGGHTAVRGNSGGIPLAFEDVTVAEVLKGAGYVTGLFGKWGLGEHGTTGVPYKQGFDEFFGYLHQIHWLRLALNRDRSGNPGSLQDGSTNDARVEAPGTASLCPCSLGCTGSLGCTRGCCRGRR